MQEPEDKQKEAASIDEIMEHMGFPRLQAQAPQPKPLTQEQQQEQDQIDEMMKYLRI